MEIFSRDEVAIHAQVKFIEAESWKHEGVNNDAEIRSL